MQKPCGHSHSHASYFTLPHNHHTTDVNEMLKILDISL